MSFDIKIIGKLKEIIDSLNPFRAGRCLSTNMNSENFDLYELSQSLSSRAMSFDKITLQTLHNSKGLNPFRAGRCLSTGTVPNGIANVGLNPFRAGRCLSTKRLIK